MGTTVISAHVELLWRGRTSDETFLDSMCGEKTCLLHVPVLSEPVRI